MLSSITHPQTVTRKEAAMNEIRVTAERECDGKDVSPWRYSLWHRGEIQIVEITAAEARQMIAALSHSLEIHEGKEVSHDT